MSRRIIVGELLPLAGIFATLPLFSPNMATLAGKLGMPSSSMELFVLPMLICTSLLGVALVISSCQRSDTHPSAPPASPAGAASYLGGFGLLAFDGLQTSSASLWPKCAAGILIGIGTVVLLRQWQGRFSLLPVRDALLNMAVACCVGSAAAMAMTLVEGVTYFVAFFTLAVIGAVAPLRWKPHGPNPPHPFAEDDLPPLSDHPIAIQTATRLASIAGTPLVGLAMFGLTMSMRKFSVFGTYDIELVAGVVASLIAITVCLAPIKRPFYSFGYQIFLPACAAVLAVCTSFPVGHPAQIASAMLMYVAFSLVGLFALASLSAIIRAGEFATSLVLGIAFASYGGASLVGVAAGQRLPEDSIGPLLLVASSLYFATLTMTAIVSLAHDAEPYLAGPAASVAELLSARCELLSRRYSLSPRETEILGYLGRGHNPTFISRELVLSLSTVRTHIRNLYKKMGISSQEELLAVLDCEEDPGQSEPS